MADQTIELNPTSHRPSIHIEVLSGPHAGESWTVESLEPITIGRQAPAHLRLPNDEGASGVHCRIEFDRGQLRITDLGSTNGTQLNGLPIQSGTVRPEDVIVIGQSEIALHALQDDKESTELPPENDPSALAELDQTLAVGSTKDEGEETIDHSMTPRAQRSEFTVSEHDHFPRAFGDYDLLDVLGQGGMATVYRAIDRRTEGTCAIKVIRSTGQPSQKQLSLFLREGSLLTRLRHPRIVRAEEVGFHEDQPFLVMEYLKTIELLEVMATLNPQARIRTASWIISRIMQALHYAHGEGIVHRDVKISNLLAFREGHRLQVKLADFGLAKLIAETNVTQLTNERSLRGTLAFMAPEQIKESRAVGFPADIYASGICLIRLLGGALPKPAFEPTGNHVEPVLESLDWIPAALASIIRKATAPLVANRYATAEEFAKELHPFHQRR